MGMENTPPAGPADPTKLFMPPRPGQQLVRLLWIGTAVLTAWMALDSIRLRWNWYSRSCQPQAPISSCPDYYQLNFPDTEGLERLGLTFPFYRSYIIGLDVLLSLSFILVACLIYTRKNRETLGLFVSFVMLASAALFMIDTIRMPPAAWSWAVPLFKAAGTGYVILLFVFPDGRFTPRWLALPAALYVTSSAVILFAGWRPPGWLHSGGLIGLHVAASLSQIGRYRNATDQLERKRLRWFLLGILLLLPYGVWNELFVTNRGIHNILVTSAVFTAVNLLVPFSIGLAILKYKLWDIRIFVNRAVLYTALSISVALIYAATVGTLGIIFQQQGNPFVSLAATGLIAVLFQPIRERLQRAVNRMMFGEADDPYGVLSRLGERLEVMLPDQEELPAIVETVAQALKLPYVAVMLNNGGQQVVAARFGSNEYPAERIPIVFRSEVVGQLLAAARGPEDSFRPRELRLLTDLARQIGGVTYSARLTMELVRSREHLVTAREEERRRLRRDLHDGLGPALAGLTLQFGVAQQLAATRPEEAKELLGRMQAQLQCAITDVRRLVYALRPPALDELGLMFALQQLTSSYPDMAPRMEIVGPEPLPPLPAAVEVAVYRICQEAVHNVVRHAEATQCRIRLWLEQDNLHVDIQDDGKGFEAEPPPGIGLHSMRERAEELGGKLQVTPADGQGPGAGARIYAILPLHRSIIR